MSRGSESGKASIGYKAKIGDYVVATTPFGMEKYYTITSVSIKLAVVKLEGRHDLRFPRIYSLPYGPVLSKPKEDKSRMVWEMRVNDTATKRRFIGNEQS